MKYNAQIRHRTRAGFAVYEYATFSADSPEELDEMILDYWPDANSENIRAETQRTWIELVEEDCN